MTSSVSVIFDSRLVESVQEKHEEKINKEKHDICQLTSILKDNKQELEFIKDHGSNNQLFLTLRKQITNIQKTDKKIHDIFDLAALICFIINDFFCFSNFLFSSLFSSIFDNVSVI
jgi:prophage maintenance system killer protein